MANTRKDVSLPKGKWVNLYSASGVPSGTAVSVYNKGSSPVQLAIASEAPDSNSFGVPMYTGSDGFMVIQANESGLWGYAEYGGIILVQED